MARKTFLTNFAPAPVLSSATRMKIAAAMARFGFGIGVSGVLRLSSIVLIYMSQNSWRFVHFNAAAHTVRGKSSLPRLPFRPRIHLFIHRDIL